MSESANPLGTVTPAAPQPPAKESFAQKAKSFFEHVWSFFGSHAEAFATSAATSIALASPLLNTLVAATAGDKAEAKVAATVASVTTKLNNVAALLKGAEAGDATHSVSGFLTEVQNDLGALLADADVKNSAKVAQITGVTKTVIGEVQAILAALSSGDATHTAPVVGAPTAA